MSAPDRIESVRLRGERLCGAHVNLLVTLYGDPQVMATLGGRVYTREETQDVVGRAMAHWQEYGFGTWVFFAEDDGRFVGRGGMHRYVLEGVDEIGLLYHVAAPEWGEGFATEITSLCLRVGFRTLGFGSMMAWTLPENHASRRVMEKCGLNFERHGVWAGLPHVFYRIPAARFEYLECQSRSEP